MGIVVFLGSFFLLPKIFSSSTKIGIQGRYTVDNIPIEITSLVSKGLTRVDDSGQVLPELAESWETSDEGKTWIFNLKRDQIWQNKDKFNSKDVNYQFSDAQIKYIDDYTVQFNLNNKFTAFPIIVSKPLFKKGLLGLGEYKVKKITLSGEIIQKIIIKKGNREITYKFYPTEERLKLAFKLGEINEMDNISDLTTFNDWKTIKIESNINYRNFVAIFINSTNEKFKDKDVRQAINYLVDKKHFSKNRALSPISPFSWAYNPQVKTYELDLDKKKTVSNLELKLTTLSNLLATAEIVKNDLSKAGIKVQIETSQNIPAEYELFLASVDIPNDPDQYGLWHSTQAGTNISRFNNPRIDKLLEDGRTEIDQEERKKIYLDFQRFLVEETPAIFLYHPTFYNVKRK